LSKLGDKEVEFDINNDNYEIVARYNGGKFTMMGESADEYPNMDNLSTEHNTSIIDDAQLIYNAINSTICATGDDMIRPVMSGVYFDYTQDYLTTVATDGRILVKYVDEKVNGKLPNGFILPQKPANVLRALLAKRNEQLTVRFDDHIIIFSCYSFLFTCRMIDGRYPNYNSVIPQQANETAYVDRKRLIDVISRMMVFSSTSEQIIMSFTNKKLKVSAQDIDFSMSSEEELPIAFEGGDIHISFNGSFLDTLLRDIRTDDVQFDMLDSKRACIIKPFVAGGGEEDTTSMLSLIMPMMID
jgi:DNA polymerase-3 subunit beta